MKTNQDILHMRRLTTGIAMLAAIAISQAVGQHAVKREFKESNHAQAIAGVPAYKPAGAAIEGVPATVVSPAMPI